MSRFVFKVAQPPPFLGSGFVLDPVTGLLDVASIAPQPLTGAILSGDSILISRNVGTAAVPNWTPYYASPSQVQALGSGSGAATTSPTPTPTTTPAPTPTPTPTSIAADGTLSGLPSTIVAGQPLTAASYVATTGSTYYLVLWNVAAAAEEGSRFAPGTMPGGTLSLLISQKAGAYTVRGFSALTGGPATYESAQINVTAAPGALPATPTQTADTGKTSSGVTMTWSATAPSYRVLTRNGVGVAYGSLSDTTTTATSYTFTGQASSTFLRAVVIPQNANGSGTPTGQFISSTTA
ncbi:MAG: hypothetical protein ACRYHQ_35715 [Janthinobacterium lividum]